MENFFSLPDSTRIYFLRMCFTFVVATGLVIHGTIKATCIFKGTRKITEKFLTYILVILIGCMFYQEAIGMALHLPSQITQ